MVYQRIARSILALALVCLSANAAVGQTSTSRIVDAADTFLSTLDQKERERVLFAFDDEKQRMRWSNFPTAVVRAGWPEHGRTEHGAALRRVGSNFFRAQPEGV